eukprot:COSAG01_NODE_7234_length_3290_cov_81.575682_1_plen_50_part_00
MHAAMQISGCQDVIDSGLRTLDPVYIMKFWRDHRSAPRQLDTRVLGQQT